MCSALNYLPGISVLLIPVALLDTFHDPFMVPKWLWIQTIALTGAVWLACHRKLRFPKSHLLLGFLTTFSTLLLLAYLIQGAHWNHDSPTIWIVFAAILVATSYSIRLDSPKSFEHLLFLGAFALVAIGVCDAILYFKGWEYEFTFFGNPNYKAEYVGLMWLMAIVLFHQTRKEKESVGRTLSLMAIPIGLCLLFLLECRAVGVALVISLGSLWYGFQKPGGSNVKRFIGIGVLLTVIAALILSYALWTRSENPMLGKIGSALNRIALWESSIEMLSDNPMGMGPNRFMFNYLSYRTKKDGDSGEIRSFHHPHNEYLSIAIDYGIPFAIFVSLALLYAIFKCLQKGRKTQDYELVLIGSVGVFLAVDAFFAFPPDAQSPFLVFCLLLGFGLAKFFPQSQPLRWWASVPASILALGLFVSFAFSHYVQSNYANHPNLTHRACALYPTNWRPCLQEARVHITHKEFDEAEKDLNRLLKRYPNHYPAMMNLSHLQFEKGKQKEACQLLEHYLSLHPGSETILTAKQRLCLS